MKCKLKQNGNWMSLSCHACIFKPRQKSAAAHGLQLLLLLRWDHVQMYRKRLPLLTWIGENSCSNEQSRKRCRHMNHDVTCELWMTTILIWMIWDPQPIQYSGTALVGFFTRAPSFKKIFFSRKINFKFINK